VRHTLLVGAEVGRQDTDNTRASGFFGAAQTAATITVPFAAPTTGRAGGLPRARTRTPTTTWT
jgi:hypothetical protein